MAWLDVPCLSIGPNISSGNCFYDDFKAVIDLAATVAWAFLKTSLELGAVYHRKLRTFVVALHKFCRDYWRRTAAV